MSGAESHSGFQRSASRVAVTSPNNPIVLFDKKVQALPTLAPLQRRLAALFVTSRAETLACFRRSWPDLPASPYWQLCPGLTTGGRRLGHARVVVAGAWYDELRHANGACKVMVFHGTFRDLTRAALGSLRGFDHVFFNGPRMARMYARYEDEFPLRHSTPGYIPFADFPAPTPAHRAAVLGPLGLDPAHPTVLYAPARGEVGSWTAHAERLVRELPHEYNLVLRPHPSLVTHGEPGRECTARVARQLAGRGAAVLAGSGALLGPLLAAADLLISDATSPAEEFLFYDRPQIFTEMCPRDAWVSRCQRDGLHRDDADGLLGLYDCGWSFARDGAAGWAPLVRQALAEPTRHAAARQRYLQWAFGAPDRGAADRAAAALQRLL